MRNHRPFALALTAALLSSCAETEPAPSVPEEMLAGVETPDADSQAPSESASFDCGKADGQAQELICADSELAAMDRELDRLYQLAEADTALSEEERSGLAAFQRGWIKGRDDCWKSDELRQCVAFEYGNRIHQLRTQSMAARISTGASVGPMTYRCDGLGEGLAATFVNTDPGLVLLSWGERQVALNRAVSADGSRYEGREDGGDIRFETDGTQAMLGLAGRDAMSCREATAG